MAKTPDSLARRIVIHAAEDVGLADPSVLPLAVAAQQCVALIGLPEARIPLAEAALAVATAPKSNATYQAIDRAIELVRTTGSLPVPSICRRTLPRRQEAIRQRCGVQVLPTTIRIMSWAQTYLPDDLIGQPDAAIFRLDGAGIGHEEVIARRLQAIDSLTQPDPHPGA